MLAETEKLSGWLYETLHPYGIYGLIVFFVITLFLLVFRDVINETVKHRNAEKLEKLKSKLKTENSDHKPVEAELKVSAAVVTENAERFRTYVQVTAVNVGTISVFVKQVQLELIPLPSTVGNIQMPAPESSYLGHTPKQPLELKPHGDTKAWQIEINPRIQFKYIFESGGGKLGIGFLELTTGKKFNFDFAMLEDSDWQQIVRTEFLRESGGKEAHKCTKCGFTFLCSNPDLVATEATTTPYVTCPRCKQIDFLRS